VPVRVSVVVSVVATPHVLSRARIGANTLPVSWDYSTLVLP